MSADDLLYYPSIEVADEGWLKSALLYWDCVYRIVPAGYVPQDSDVVREAVDAGLLRNLLPEDADRKKAGARFKKMIASFGEYGLPAGFEGDEYIDVHEDKIDSSLYPILDEIAAAHDHGWIKLSKPMARGYMLQLAQTMARRRNLSLGTDNSGSWVVSSFVASRGNISEYIWPDENDAYMASLCWRDMIPANVREVPMKDIAAFALRRRDEKRRFRAEVLEFADSLAKCESDDHVAELIERFKQRIPDAIRGVKANMKFAATGIPGSALVQGVPVFIGTLGTLLTMGQPLEAQTLVGSISVGLVAAFIDSKRAKSQLSKSIVGSYLIDASLLGGPSVYRFDRLMNEFIND